jgi:thiamine kinase
VIACDLAQGILVTRYLGPTCDAIQLGEPAYIKRLARVFRRLHALPALEGIREIHLPTVIAGYLETLQTLSRNSPLSEPSLTARALERAAEISESTLPCLCHNDVHHLNVVDCAPLRLLDWEYAGIGDAFFDLASLSVYEEYSQQQRQQLLDAYLGSVTAADLERLAKCCWLFEYVRDLWMEVRAAVDGHKG